MSSNFSFGYYYEIDLHIIERVKVYIYIPK